MHAHLLLFDKMTVQTYILAQKTFSSPVEKKNV